MNLRPLVCLAAVFSAAAFADGPAVYPDAAKLKALNARLAPVDLVVDVSKLPKNEQAALAKMIASAKVLDALFLRQVWAGNETLLLDLLRDTSPLGKARLD